MQYMITAHDGENMLAKRLEVRSRHLENLATVKGKIIKEHVWETVEVEVMNVVILDGKKVGK